MSEEAIAGPRPEWWIPEAEQFENALNNALRVEDSRDADAGGEPECEHPGEAEVSGVCLQSLHKSVTRHVVMPLMNGEPASPEAQQALKQFPGVIEELMTLLQKTSRLAYVRGHKKHELTSRLSTAETSLTHLQRSEVERLSAASVDDDGQEGSAMTRLTAARKTLKQKDWELAEARRKIQQVEEERVRQEKRLRALELALESANMARQEAERRCAEGGDEASALQRSELRRRILETERALDEARLELDVAERRADGARGAGSPGRPHAFTDECLAMARRDSWPEDEDDKFDVQSLRSQRTTRSRKSMPSQRNAAAPPAPSAGGGAEQAGQALDRSRRRTTGYSSAPVLPRSPAEPGALPTPSSPTAPRGENPQQNSPAAGQAAGQAAMPGDLRSLGQLLAGGGLFGAGKK